MNANVRAQNLIGLMEDLVELLERENALLEKPRSRELGPVIEEKQALFKLYEEQVHSIANDNEFAGSLQPELRQRLSEVGERFDDLARINERKLKVMSEASKHIVDKIAEAARNAAGHVDSYGSNGASNSEISPSAPVALNRNF